MRLTQAEIEDIKQHVRNEVKDAYYGEKKVNIYSSLSELNSVSKIDLDLSYELSVAPIVESGLVLLATLTHFEAFGNYGSSVIVSNKEELRTVTVKLW